MPNRSLADEAGISVKDHIKDERDSYLYLLSFSERPCLWSSL